MLVKQFSSQSNIYLLIFCISAMSKVFLKVMQPVNRDADSQVLMQFLPEVSSICSNKIRSGILHLLIKSPETLHSMKVERLCYMLGIRQSVCIYHLEKLKEWKIVEVKKNQKYGNKSRRSIWGLDLRYPIGFQNVTKQ